MTAMHHGVSCGRVATRLRAVRLCRVDAGLCRAWRAGALSACGRPRRLHAKTHGRPPVPRAPELADRTLFEQSCRQLGGR